MAHHCNRCRTEYESGGFHNGLDYCNPCLQTLKMKDELKRREEADRQQKIIDDKRKLVRMTAITEMEKKYRSQREELKRRRTVEEMKRREAQNAKAQLAAQKQRKRHELMHQAGYGRPGSSNFSFTGSGQSAYDGAGVLPLDQQHRSRIKPVKAEKNEPRDTSGWASHSTTEFTLDEHGAAARNECPLSLSVEKSLPNEIDAGQASRAVLIGKNATAKKIEVNLIAVLKGNGGNQCSLAVDPKKCFIEAGGEARFEIRITPLKGASGELLLEANLKENAFYIDPGQGRSETLAMESKISKK